MTLTNAVHARAPLTPRALRARLAAAVLTTIALTVGASADAVAAPMPHATATSHAATPHVTCTDTWDGGTGQWANGSDWSNGEPAAGNDSVVCITAAGSDVQVQNVDASIGQLVLGGSSGSPVTLDVITSDTLQSGVEVGADSQIDATGVVELTSAADASTFYASLSSMPTATITNDGTIETSGYKTLLYGNLTNDASGTVTLHAATTEINTQTIINKGSLNVEAGATLELFSPRFTQSSGTIDNLGTITQNNNTFDMAGGAETHNPIEFSGYVQFTDSAGTGSFQTEAGNSMVGTIPAGQTVTVTSTASVESNMNFTSPVVNHGTLVLDVGAANQGDGFEGSPLQNFGTIDVRAVGAGALFNATVTNEPGATIRATGAGFVVNHDLQNDGRLLLGPGTKLTDNGYPIREGTAATLGVTIGTHDSALVAESGCTISLAGSLAVTTTTALPRGTRARPIGSPQLTVSGRFSRLSFPSTAYSVAYGPTSVTLTVPFTAKGRAVKAIAGRSTRFTLATISGAPAGARFSSEISWGDGSKSAGTVAVRGTTAVVTGVHRFARKGTFVVRVVIKDSDGTLRTVTDRASVS